MGQRLRRDGRWMRCGRLAVAAVLLAAPALAFAQATQLLGTPGDDTINGSSGADAIFALAGNDRISGAAGDDDIDGGAGSDDIRGGAGSDAVLYGDRTVAVAVTLDDVANDGEAGESDDVHADVEQIFGGGAGDRLTGSARGNIIDGAGGDDSITDGGGVDRVYGGDGDDVITTFDGADDVVDCGPGTDTLTADRADRVTGCEKRIPARRVRSPVDYHINVVDGRALVVRLTVSQIPRRGRVELRCRGGCPISVARLPSGRATVRLAGLLRNRRLGRAAVVEVRITQPESIGKVVVFTMRRSSAQVTTLCLPPGAAAPRKLC